MSSQQFESPSDLQYLKDCNVQSNSEFYYHDLTSNNYEHRIKLDPSNERKMDIRSYIPLNHLHQTVIKEPPLPPSENAFDKADIESDIAKQISHHKYQQLLQKEKSIAERNSKKNKEIRDNFIKEKMELKAELTAIIRDALTFSKKNNPMISMLPNSIAKLQDNKMLNMSSNSLNMSQASRVSSRSIQKYESNAFLKSLGIDLLNLSPDNINIDIDKAYANIQNWKTDRNIREVIRYKVVNEIMSVEEKRASQKVEKLNKKLAVYKTKKKEESVRLKKELEEAMKAEEDKKDPKMKMKMRMIQSVNTKKDFSVKKKGTNFSSFGEKKRVETKKRKKDKNKITNTEPKKKIKLNSYHHVDKILKFIHQSDELSENPAICKHFLNIKYNKKMDDLTKKLLSKNKLESVVDNDFRLF